ncbi:Pre-mRNA-splicing factor SPF27 [Pavlovales sp. CCMP2436]|nr:Pre-mRNA-splicing factor SPF27 [Pavlovales sp. CCMP2436]
MARSTAGSALPYVDTELDRPGMREHVRSLIEAEMKSFRPSRDYVAHIPAPELALEGTQLLQSELMRLAEGQPMPPLDMSRLQMDAPGQGRQNDPVAWLQAVHNAESQLEQQTNRLDNLELMQQYGAAAWRAHLAQLEGMAGQLDKEHDQVKARIEAVNKKRKYEQLEAAKKLRSFENDWLEAVQKNRAIEAAIARVHAEHAALKVAAS